jgi:hypothetical protein
MQAQELRIGNLINYLNDIKTVSFWDFEEMEQSMYNYKPIPLTEEWLISFGFYILHTTKGNTLIYWKGEKQRVNYNNGCFFYKVYNGTLPIKYVHQLQNLYFALAGTELTTPILTH